MEAAKTVLDKHIKTVEKMTLKQKKKKPKFKGAVFKRQDNRPDVKEWGKEEDKPESSRNPFDHKPDLLSDLNKSDEEDGNGLQAEKSSSGRLHTEITNSDAPPDVANPTLEESDSNLGSNDAESDTSSVRCGRKLKEMGLDKKFLVVECGCSNYDVL